MSWSDSTQDGMSGCAVDLPDSGVYLRGVSTVHLVLICVCGGLTFITLVMYIETVVFFFRNLYNWKPKDKAKWVLAVYPIHTLTSFISLVVPRSSNVNELIAACYLSICIYQFVTMLIGHYGGARRMSNKLADTTIQLNTNPCCCCCKCLPTPKVTSHNIHVIQTLVIQYAVAGPILAYCMAIVWANSHYYQNPFKNPASYMSLVNTISSVVALWGMGVTFGLAQPFLSHAHIKQKFFCVQLVNMFTNLQSFFIDVLVVSGVIKCDSQLNADAVGVRYHNICLTFEMFVLWIIARHYYRRDISDIPVEDQVYVDTCNVGTSISGTLNRTSSSDIPFRGPTSAREWLTQDYERASMNPDGSKSSVPMWLEQTMADNGQYHGRSAVEARHARNKRRKKNSDYEPVEFKKVPLPFKSEVGIGTDPVFEPDGDHIKQGYQAKTNAKSPVRFSDDVTEIQSVVTRKGTDVEFPAGITNPQSKVQKKDPRPPNLEKQERLYTPQATIPKPMRQRSRNSRTKQSDVASSTGTDSVSETM